MPMMDRRLIKNFDFYLLLLVLTLCAVGTVTLYSATHVMEELSDPMYYVRRQLMVTAFGLAAMLIVCFIDYINFQNWARYLYLGGLALLALVLVMGSVRKGSMRVIPIGFFDLQPSEIAKFMIIVMLAKLLADREGHFHSLQDLMPSLLATALPMGLILLQPDLGTSLVFMAILAGMFYVAGVKKREMLILAAGGLVAAPLAWFFVLHDYQKMRLMVFLNPGMDPTGTGLQLLQSMIGIGSGGLFGQGLFESTQARLRFCRNTIPILSFRFSGRDGLYRAVALLLLSLDLPHPLDCHPCQGPVRGADLYRGGGDAHLPDAGQYRHDHQRDAGDRNPASFLELRQ